MKKLLYILALLPALAFGQTYNVAITNSLLGPVNLSFTNTTVSANAATVTGVTVNASITNSFSPVNNITNDITIGGTTVNNTNTFVTYITNNVDVAGVVITNIIENIVQSNNYYTTSGVSSVSFTGAVDGAIVLAAGNNISINQTNRTFNFSSTASGGGISHWTATTGTSTQAGSYLYATSQVPDGISNSFGLFVGTNRSISFTRPDGTVSGGNAVGANSVTLVPGRTSADKVARGDTSVAIGYNAGIIGSLQRGIAIGDNATIGINAGVGGNSIAIGYVATAGTGGNEAIAIGRQSSAPNNAIAIGSGANASASYSVAIGGNAGSGGVGQYSLSLGGGEEFGTRFARASAERSGAIGFRAKGTNYGAMVFTDGVDADRGTMGSNTVTFSFNGGAFLTRTNAVYARIIPRYTTNVANDGFILAGENDVHGLFIGTNQSISVSAPDGTEIGGAARGAGSIDLQGYQAGSIQTRATASQVVSAPRSVMMGTWRSTISGSGAGNVLLGGSGGSASTISSGGGHFIAGTDGATINAGNNNFVIGYPASVTVGGNQGNGVVGGAGGVSHGTIAGYGSVVIASDGSSVSSAGYNTLLAATRYSAVTGTTIAGAYASVIMAGESMTNGARQSVLMGGNIVNSHAGNFIWRGYDATTTQFVSAKTNTVLFRTSAFGINTNDPQQALHVNGAIRADTAYHLGSNAGITVTQKFLDASSNIRTNIYIGGILVSGYTE